MLQTKLKEDYISPIGRDSGEIVNFVKKSIRKNKNSNMTVDISSLNVIEASKVAVLCSTYHYLKHPNGAIDWIVNSSQIEKLVKPLNLGNSKFLYNI